jgi:hypothetical protein
MKVQMLRYDDGSCAFQFGSAGTPFGFEPGDEDSLAVAFTKAVNEGVESGQEIEGEAAVLVAEVLKEAGAVVWDSEEALCDWQGDLSSQIPQGANGCPIGYIEDVAVGGEKVLICTYENGDMTRYVADVSVVADEPVLAPRSAWIEVEEQFVAKYGRALSNKTFEAARAAHEALGSLISRGEAERVREAEKGGKPKPGTKPDKRLSENMEKDAEEEEDTEKAVLSYSVSKATGAMRYTLGPLYAPMRKDAHGEYVEDDVLHKSLHEYVRDSAESGRRINLQHGDKGDVQCGEWVECVRWPYEHTIKMTDASGDEHEVEMPAGTVYLGVVWDEDHWDVEKNRPKNIDGYSLGGRAVKMRDDSTDLADMGYKVAKAV